MSNFQCVKRSLLDRSPSPKDHKHDPVVGETKQLIMYKKFIVTLKVRSLFEQFSKLTLM